MSMSNSFLILPLLSSWRNFLSEDFFFPCFDFTWFPSLLLFHFFFVFITKASRFRSCWVSSTFNWVLCAQPVSLLSDLFHVAFSKMSLLIDDFLGKLTYLNFHSPSTLLMCMKVNNGWSVKYEKGVEAFTELL